MLEAFLEAFDWAVVGLQNRGAGCYYDYHPGGYGGNGDGPKRETKMGKDDYIALLHSIKAESNELSKILNLLPEGLPDLPSDMRETLMYQNAMLAFIGSKVGQRPYTLKGECPHCLNDLKVSPKKADDGTYEVLLKCVSGHSGDCRNLKIKLCVA